MRKWGLLCLALLGCGALAISCGDDASSGGDPPAGNAGDGGRATEVGGGSGGNPAQAGHQSAAGDAGMRSAEGGATAAHQGGSAGETAGAGGSAGEGGAAGAAAGGMPPLVAEQSCLQNEDCLAVCAAYGWPSAHCYGAETRFCACDSSSDGPTCVKGTTEGCPPGTACRLPHQCMPAGEATQGDPCNNGDECAAGFTCVGFGNPLPNGESTACCEICEPQNPPPGCDCTSGYCIGGFGGAPN